MSLWGEKTTGYLIKLMNENNQSITAVTQLWGSNPIGRANPRAYNQITSRVCVLRKNGVLPRAGYNDNNALDTVARIYDNQINLFRDMLSPNKRSRSDSSLDEDMADVKEEESMEQRSSKKHNSDPHVDDKFNLDDLEETLSEKPRDAEGIIEIVESFFVPFAAPIQSMETQIGMENIVKTIAPDIEGEVSVNLFCFGLSGIDFLPMVRTLAKERMRSLAEVQLKPIIEKGKDVPEFFKILYDRAVARAPCVVLINQIEELLLQNNAIIRNSFMEFLSSVESGEGTVIVIGACFNPFKLTEAHLRPFYTRLYVPLMDQAAATALLSFHFQRAKLFVDSALINEVAELLVKKRCTRADIAQIAVDCRAEYRKASHHIELAKIKEENEGTLRKAVINRDIVMSIMQELGSEDNLASTIKQETIDTFKEWAFRTRMMRRADIDKYFSPQ